MTKKNNQTEKSTSGFIELTKMDTWLLNGEAVPFRDKLVVLNFLQALYDKGKL